MKFIYYNVDRLSLVLPWKTHRYSKGSKSRKGKERGEMSIGKQRELGDSQTVSHPQWAAQDLCRVCRQNHQPVLGPHSHLAFTLAELILTPSPHLWFWLWSPFSDIKKPRGWGGKPNELPHLLWALAARGTHLSTSSAFTDNEWFLRGILLNISRT